jgi:predicted PurR-regulated permease PerM
LLLALVGGLGFTANSLRDEAAAVMEELPEGVRKLRSELNAMRGRPGALESVQRAAQELDRTAAEASVQTPAPEGVVKVQVEEPAFRARDYLWSGSIGATGLVSLGLMILFLTFFLLVADDLFRRKVVKHVGSTLSSKKVTVQILDEISCQIERFLLVQLLTSLLVAVVTGAVLWWLELRQAVVWGLLAGLFNSVPYFGPFIVTIGLMIVAFLQFGSLGMAVLVAGIALAITTLEGWLLTPALMGRVAQMNAMAVFAGLLFWSWMWGVWGILLAVPMMMVVKVICDHVQKLQPLGDLLGE